MSTCGRRWLTAWARGTEQACTQTPTTSLEIYGGPESPLGAPHGDALLLLCCRLYVTGQILGYKRCGLCTWQQRSGWAAHGCWAGAPGCSRVAGGLLLCVAGQAALGTPWQRRSMRLEAGLVGSGRPRLTAAAAAAAAQRLFSGGAGASGAAFDRQQRSAVRSCEQEEGSRGAALAGDEGGRAGRAGPPSGQEAAARAHLCAPHDMLCTRCLRCAGARPTSTTTPP